MPNASFYRDQADRFDRVADQCTIPQLVPYYRTLAEDYRQRAAEADMASLQQDFPLERYASG